MTDITLLGLRISVYTRIVRSPDHPLQFWMEQWFALATEQQSFEAPASHIGHQFTDLS